jgi:dethiobiotin synthetase
MSKGIFIVGTDTEVGKTVVSAGLTLILKKRGIRVGVVKPIATGCELRNGEHYSEDAAYLAAAAGLDDDRSVTPFRFSLPLAPHVAAKLDGTTIDTSAVTRACRDVINRHEFTIIEGIGGLMVPITNKYFVRDLIADLDLPVIVVARAKLGTINHTLLTVESLRDRYCDIKGIILNTCIKRAVTVAEQTNPAVVQELSGVPVLGTVPYIDGLNIKEKTFGSLCDEFDRCIDFEL